jgi:hypothetical protein
LTVSASQDTHLELNWITECPHPDNLRPDYIALYNYDLKDRNVSHLDSYGLCNLD